MDFIDIERCKEYDCYRKYQERLSLEPFSSHEDEELRELEEKLKQRYGKDYNSDFGWASPIFDGKRVTFSMIEDKVGLDHLTPYYKLACKDVHCGTKGNFFRIGVFENDSSVLFCGSSNYGLDDAGQYATLSLTQISTVLFSNIPSVEMIAGSKLLNMLDDEICGEFVKVGNGIRSKKQ